MLLVSSTVISPLSTADEGTTFDEPPPEVENSEQIRSYPGTDNEVSSGYVQLKLDWINDGFPGRVDALRLLSRDQQLNRAQMHIRKVIQSRLIKGVNRRKRLSQS